MLRLRMSLVVLALVVGVLGTVSACKRSPFGVVLYAQTLPVTKTLAWDASANTDSYVVRLDGTSIGTPTGTTQAFTVTTVGPHSLSVQSVNLWGQSSVTTLAFTVVLPGAPTNTRIQ
jgi:hypothetical protein